MKYNQVKFKMKLQKIGLTQLVEFLITEHWLAVQLQSISVNCGLHVLLGIFSRIDVLTCAAVE